MLCKAECTRDEMQERVHCRAATRFLQQKVTVQIPLLSARCASAATYNILIPFSSSYQIAIFRPALVIESLHNQSPLARKLNYAKRSLNGTSTIQIWCGAWKDGNPIFRSIVPQQQPLLPTSLFLSAASLSSLFYFSRRASLDLHLHAAADNGRKVHRADLGANLASQLPLNALLYYYEDYWDYDGGWKTCDQKCSRRNTRHHVLIRLCVFFLLQPGGCAVSAAAWCERSSSPSATHPRVGTSQVYVSRPHPDLFSSKPLPHQDAGEMCVWLFDYGVDKAETFFTTLSSKRFPPTEVNTFFLLMGQWPMPISVFNNPRQFDDNFLVLRAQKMFLISFIVAGPSRAPRGNGSCVNEIALVKGALFFKWSVLPCRTASGNLSLNMFFHMCERIAAIGPRQHKCVRV